MSRGSQPGAFTLPAIFLPSRRARRRRADHGSTQGVVKRHARSVLVGEGPEKKAGARRGLMEQGESRGPNAGRRTGCRRFASSARRVKNRRAVSSLALKAAGVKHATARMRTQAKRCEEIVQFALLFTCRYRWSLGRGVAASCGRARGRFARADAGAGRWRRMRNDSHSDVRRRRR